LPFIRMVVLYKEKKQIHFKSIQRSFDLATREKGMNAARLIIEAAKKAPLDQTEDITKECMEQIPSVKRAESNGPECEYEVSLNKIEILSLTYSAVTPIRFRMAFTTIRGEVTPVCDSFLKPRIFALREYEESCYLVNRSTEQNGFYRTPSRQSKTSVQQPDIAPNSESEPL
jgi:hypothetical protein